MTDDAGVCSITVVPGGDAGQDGEAGTLLRVVAPSRHIRMGDLLPVFESMDLCLVSYTAERDPDAPTGAAAVAGASGRRKAASSFRGLFLITTNDGDPLSEDMLECLQEALMQQLRISNAALLRRAVQDSSRRDSVASYTGTEASMDPDSPSAAAAAAAAVAAAAAAGHGPCHHGLSHLNSGAGGSGSLSHLNPAAHHMHSHSSTQSLPAHHHQAYQPQASLYGHYGAVHGQVPPQHHHTTTGAHAPSNLGPGAQAHHHPQQQQQQQHPHQHHHDHTASAGSMLFSEHSVSSVGSLLRVASGAPSDMAAVPSPPANVHTASFSFLQQHADSVLLDSAPNSTVVGALNTATTSTSSLGVLDEAGRAVGHYSVPAQQSPFAAVSQQQPHHQHTQSQPTPHAHTRSQGQAGELYDYALGLTVRSSSASCTPPPPQPRSDGDAAAGRSEPSPAGAAPASRADSGRGRLAASLQPVAATAGGTPHQSRPCSGAQLVFTAGNTGSSTSGSTPAASTVINIAVMSAAAAAGSTAPIAASPPNYSPLAMLAASGADTPAGTESITSAVFGPGAAVGAAEPASTATNVLEEVDDSPTSEERDGTYAWWSTVSARDTVASIMSQPARSISSEADLGAAKSMMTKHNISALLVDTGGPNPGFITKRDFLKVQFSKNFKKTKVKDVMTQPVIYVDIGLPIEECSRVLEAYGVRRVLVHDPLRCTGDDPLAAFVGVVSDADLFKCMGAPALSPVVGSMANSTEQSPGMPLPAMPPLPRLDGPGGAGALSPGSAFAAGPPVALATMSSVNSASATASVSGSAGPSHAPSTASAANMGASIAQALTAVEAASAASGMTAAPSGAAPSSSSMVRLSAESSLAERYRCAAALWELDFNELEVTRRIGEGSFGEVLLANFRGTKVAVKRLRGFECGPDNPDTGETGETGPSPTQMPIFRQFFEREIEILATIRHPNVVNFIGACHTPPNVCLVTEYCARGSLDHLLHKSSIHIDTLKKVEFSMDIARGMGCLHSQKPPIIHRDLKSANLLVSARFEVKVADFGLSRIKDHAQLINSRAGLEGTVEYAAPEVLRGEPYTEKCDIWSYSILLWELIHRQRPYADADVPIYILMMSLGNGSLRLPPVREDLATPGLARLVERCMAWVPADRPSFREILHALEAEYKIIRGKAAAVPRSDSASSMMVIQPGNQASTSGGSAAQPSAHPTEGHVQSHSQPHAHPHHPHPSGLPPTHSAHSPGNRPANLPTGPGAALAQRKSSKLGMNVGHAGEPARQSSNEHGEPHTSGSHVQAAAPAPRPRVKLLVPAAAGSSATQNSGAEPSDPSSPADSSRPSSSRATGPSTGGRAAGTGGKASGGKASGGKASGGRAMRAALRSKSMPLPEFEWLGGEDGSEDYVETTESVADEDGEPGQSGGTTASGVVPGAPGARAPHPLSRLASSQAESDIHAANDVPGGMVADGRVQVTAEESEEAGHAHGVAGEHASPRLPQHLVVKLPQQRVGWEGVEVVRANSSQSPSSKGRRQQLSADDATSGGDSGVGSGANSSKVQTPFYTAAGSTPRHSHLHPGADAAARRGPGGAAPAPAEPGSGLAAAAHGTASAARASPFHMAANSPFADAADMPWSPRPTDAVGSGSPNFRSPRTSHKGMAQPGPASAGAGAVPAPAPRRVTFVSPFAQMASEVPSEAEEEEPAVAERLRRRSSGRVVEGGATVSSPSESEEEGEAPPPPPPRVAAASTANSTDVHVLVEKDQHPAWAVLGACSKPPSGDVYPPGGLGGVVAGRVSPPPQPLQPPSYAAMRAAAASPFAMVASYEPAEEVTSPRTEGLVPEAAAAVAAAAAAAARAPAGASTTEEELPLPHPAVGGFGGMGLTSGSGSDSDQFDDGDDDATLHTTAWVRL